MRTLVLWDIDGTLMRGDATVGQIFIQALREVYRLPEAVKRIQYGGKTDPQIVLQTLALHDIDEATALQHLPHFSDRYHQLLEAARHNLRRALMVLPGVEAVLVQLQKQGAIQTVLTGNIAPVAALKLRATGLDRYIDIQLGAYGSDHHDRTKLVPIARKRAIERYGEELSVTVVGDTPADIACSRAGDAHTVAVATGTFSTIELAEHRPDVLLSDLRDHNVVVKAILNNEH
jgi:phosphoglycolate phosphatase